MSFSATVERSIGAPHGARVLWLLELLGGKAATASPTEVAPSLGPFAGRPETFLYMLGFWRQRLGAFDAVAVDRDADGMLVVDLNDAKGRLWTVRCRIGDAEPYRLEFYSVTRPLPPGVRLRRACEADADALSELERCSPIERDDGSRVTLVRGSSIFEQLRLAEWAELWLAEEDGAAVACYATARHRARIGGREVDLVYLFHTRVLPSHRRLGLNETLLAWLGEQRFKQSIRGEGFYVYVDPRNEVIRDWSPATPWRVRPLRALLSCRALSGPEVGRPATTADAARIAAILGAAHGGEEVFLPYDPPRLTARLTRLPERYGFAHLQLTDNAVVGVWEDGERRILEHAGEREESCRATVLDWGFAGETGLASLEALLRAWCGRLAGRGLTHLSIFFSEASRATGLLRSLAESVVEIEFRCTGLPEPTDSVERGLCVDPVYY